MKQIVNYPMGDVENQPVINIAGRDYVVMSYVAPAHIPAEYVEFVKKYPERDDVDFMLNQAAELMVQDIVNYLRDAVPVTIVKSENQPDESVATAYDLFLPMLMPLDTKDRWDENSTERAQALAAKALETGKPYIFKMGETK